MRISCLQHSRNIGSNKFLIPEGYQRNLFPPELKHSSSEITPAADIWSLGLVFLCLVSDESLDSVSVNPGNVISKLENKLPSELSSLCLNWIADDPAARPQSCEELVTILDTIQGSRTPTRVFVSHSSKDRNQIEDLVVRPLESCGYKTWYSKNEIKSATEWERGILEGLRSCDWFLVAVSQSSLSSSWVKDELYWAIEERPEYIIPAMLDSTDPRELHIRLGRLQSIDLLEEGAVVNMLKVLQSK